MIFRPDLYTAFRRDRDVTEIAKTLALGDRLLLKVCLGFSFEHGDLKAQKFNVFAQEIAEFRTQSLGLGFAGLDDADA